MYKCIIYSHTAGGVKIFLAVMHIAFRMTGHRYSSTMYAYIYIYILSILYYHRSKLFIIVYVCRIYIYNGPWPQQRSSTFYEYIVYESESNLHVYRYCQTLKLYIGNNIIEQNGHWLLCVRTNRYTNIVYLHIYIWHR